MANILPPVANISGAPRSPSVPAPDLTTLAKDINECLGDLAKTYRNSLIYAFKLGDLLKDAKSTVGHGNWKQWLEANCKELSERTAQRYMSVAEGRPKIEEHMKIKSATVADFTLRQAERLIAKPKGNGHSETKPSVAEAVTSSGASNDPVQAVTAVREKLITALNNLRLNYDDKKAREAAASVIKRLKELSFIA